MARKRYDVVYKLSVWTVTHAGSTVSRRVLDASQVNGGLDVEFVHELAGPQARQPPAPSPHPAYSRPPAAAVLDQTTPATLPVIA